MPSLTFPRQASAGQQPDRDHTDLHITDWLALHSVQSLKFTHIGLGGLSILLAILVVLTILYDSQRAVQSQMQSTRRCVATFLGSHLILT